MRGRHANIRSKGGITGDWHPVFKALRDRMVDQDVGWRELGEAAGVSHVTLTTSFSGKNGITFSRLELAANALGYHLALVPMTEDELEALGRGEYTNPGVVEARNANP